jgi:hypothetical protein
MQYFTVRNDPLNSLLDMLPGYALEMRSQDIQRKQERRRVQLAEKTQKDLNLRQIEESGRAQKRLGMDVTSFGWQEEAYEQQKLLKQTQTDFLNAKRHVSSDLRNQQKEHQNFQEKYSDLFDKYEETKDGKNYRGLMLNTFGQPSSYSFEAFLDDRLDVDYPGKVATKDDIKYKKVKEEFKALPTFDIEWPEVQIPEGIDMTPSLYEYWAQSLIPLKDEMINELFSRYGGPQALGVKVESDPRISAQGKAREPKPELGLMDMLFGGGVPSGW